MAGTEARRSSGVTAARGRATFSGFRVVIQPRDKPSYHGIVVPEKRLPATGPSAGRELLGVPRDRRSAGRRVEDGPDDWTDQTRTRDERQLATARPASVYATVLTATTRTSLLQGKGV
jgi:hypothetical protein